MISKCSDILGLKVLKMSLSPFTRRFISMTVYGAVTMLLLYGTASLYWNVKDFTIKEPKLFDVVLNSYMRGGSTLTGIVLGFRTDSFYVYEPLWKTSRWVYWRGNDTVCRSDRDECRKFTSAEQNVNPKFLSNARSCSMAANSVVSDRIWPKFKLIHAFMYVLVTYKNEDDQMKNEGTRVVTTLYSYILDGQGQLTAVGGRVWPKIKLIQAFMVVLFTCKNQEDPFRNEVARVVTTDLTFMTGSLLLAQNILYKIYDCQLNDFDRFVVSHRVTVGLGGPGWLNTSRCITKTKQQQSCVMENIPKMCMAASHRVTKVLRMTLDNLEYLLQTRDNLKIIHLFRDPRAIINSRIETKWYPVTNTQNLLSNAKSLCSKMLYDFHEGLRLYNLYPDRFRFLYYEDLNDDPLGKVKLIYRYLGMQLDQSKFKAISKIKVFNNSNAKTERERNTAFWWRKTLKWDITKQIDEICKDVYDVLGYKTFSSNADQVNWTRKSVVIPSDFVF